MDRIIRRHAVFVFSFLFLLSFGSWYVLFQIDTEFNHTECTQADYNRPQCLNQINDIIRYFGYARTESLSQLAPAVADILGLNGDQPTGHLSFFTGIGLTNLLTLSLMSLCLYVMPGMPYLMAYLIQLLTLPYYYYCLTRIAKLIPESRRSLFYGACLLAPFVLASLSVLGKEYLSILFVTGALANALEKRRVPILILSILGAMVREVNLIIGFCFLALTFERIKPWHVFLGFGCLIPVADAVVPSFETFRTVWAAINQQNASSAMSFLASVQSIPFGQLIVGPVLLLLNIAGPGFGPTAIASLLNGALGLYGVSVIWASYFFLAVGIAAFHACYKRNLWRHPLVIMLACTVLATAILPLIQLRYYYPLWPMMLAVSFMALETPRLEPISETA